ncbi:MAG: 3'(2'),5'-bisphosphate nucleotidase CysQ [Hyphomicrobiales bacterium]|nr:3'(2'),5'-bisphosphate nucleotidase CysQ [Hyphomicrobiales bacterium]
MKVAQTDLDDDLRLLKTAGAEAADLALTYFKRDPKVWTKDGGSPVSEADFAVDARLAETLRAARPGYGWLSEETADNADRLKCSRLFVVDPIDGTRAFLDGSTDWTVSLAVVEQGRPVASVLVGPALSTTFWATARGGAFRDGRRLAATDPLSLVNIRLAASRRVMRAFEPRHGAPPKRRYIASLAYRLAQVATGDLDTVIVSPGAQDWDLAAADLLVQEAGARLADLTGDPLRYNRPETSCPMLVAASPRLFGQVVEVVGGERERAEA